MTVAVWGRLVGGGRELPMHIQLDEVGASIRVATALNEDGSEDCVLAWCRLWIYRLPLRPTCALLRIDEEAEMCEIRLNGDELLHARDHLLQAGDVLSVHAQEAGSGCLRRVIVRAQGRNLDDLPGALHWTFEPDPFMVWACDALYKSDQAVHLLKRSVEAAPLNWQSYPEVAADELARRRALRGFSSCAANARAGAANARAAAEGEARESTLATPTAAPVGFTSATTPALKRAAEDEASEPGASKAQAR